MMRLFQTNITCIFWLFWSFWVYIKQGEYHSSAYMICLASQVFAEVKSFSLLWRGKGSRAWKSQLLRLQQFKHVVCLQLSWEVNNSSNAHSLLGPSSSLLAAILMLFILSFYSFKSSILASHLQSKIQWCVWKANTHTNTHSLFLFFYSFISCLCVCVRVCRYCRMFFLFEHSLPCQSNLMHNIIPVHDQAWK